MNSYSYPTILSEGLVHLFDPCINNRVSDQLMGAAMTGCKHRDETKLREAIRILSVCHTTATI